MEVAKHVSTLLSAYAHIADPDQQLESLSKDLLQEVEALNDELLNVIDGDYQMFLGLSTDLGLVDATVGVLRTPLLNLQARVESLKEEVQAPLVRYVE